MKILILLFKRNRNIDLKMTLSNSVVSTEKTFGY